MTQTTRRQIVLGAAAAGLLPGAAFAQKKYGPGTSDTEIRIGQTIAYSGPASAYGQLGRAEAAYFKFLNDKGGINGRKGRSANIRRRCAWRRGEVTAN